MEALQRNYAIKDIDMLVAAATIIDSAIRNKAFLQSKRSTWKDPFFDDLKRRMDKVVQSCLGVESAKELRLATQIIIAIQKQAIQGLAEVKVQIGEDYRNYKPRRDEILNQLGFAGYHKSAQQGDQEALQQLLYLFKTNLTAALKHELIGNGVERDTLDTIISYAETFRLSDMDKELFESERRVISADYIKAFNEIYDCIISICKIASKFYKDTPHLKDQFNFNKIVKRLSIQSKPRAVKPIPLTNR
jgi:hypothetical protein